ncbi:MAG: HU family DNA-binding protein, partial [Flavobacteriales bacterium]
MNKTDLIDAMASNSGLSKADSKRALEGFMDA